MPFLSLECNHGQHCSYTIPMEGLRNDPVTFRPRLRLPEDTSTGLGLSVASVYKDADQGRRWPSSTQKPEVTLRPTLGKIDNPGKYDPFAFHHNRILPAQRKRTSPVPFLYTSAPPMASHYLDARFDVIESNGPRILTSDSRRSSLTWRRKSQLTPDRPEDQDMWRRKSELHRDGEDDMWRRKSQLSQDSLQYFPPPREELKDA